jgi:integrase
MPRYKNGLARVGKFFHYCFKIKGVQFKGSTHAIDRATAETVLATKRKDALLGPQEITLPMPTMKALVESWVKSYGTTYSSKHLESVQGFAKVWINPEIGDCLVNRVSTQRVLDLRRKLLDSGRSPATANLLLRILKLLVSHAVRLGHIKERPFQVSPLRFQKKPRPIVPAATMSKFLEAAARTSRDAQVGVMLTTMVGLQGHRMIRSRMSGT